jgi:hypothetical protein
MLMLDEASYVELDEVDIIQGINDCEILTFERYMSGALVDRRLAHKQEKVDVQFIRPGEEMQIRRLA